MPGTGSLRGIVATAMVAFAMFAGRPAAAVTLEARTVASADDAEERATGSMYLTSTDLELTHDSSDQTVGMRWIALAIPPGATITAAYIQFSAKEAQSEVTTLTLRGQAADSPLAFASPNFNITTRPRTTAAATWTPAAWLAGEVGANQRTPDLSTVIQEIVNRPGWLSGNALAIIINGTGHRTAHAWNGKPASSPLLHIEYTTGPAPEAPPVARLSVGQLASPALTVRADGSASTDVDATPIATYLFTFGDGSAAVTTNAPTATAQHTYAAAGSYTVTLIATDTGNNPSAPATYTINVTNTVTDAPPVARLTVSQLPSPALTVRADGSTSTDTDATPISSYRFTFGDGSAAVTTNAPTASAQHTYAASGSYTVTLIATDTGGNPSASTTYTITVAPPSGAQVAVYGGYYDTHHPHLIQPKPNPWMGSPNTVFIGTPDSPGTQKWDTSALRLDNLTSATLSGVAVTADIGSHHYALWGTDTIPSGWHLVLAQTAFDNFDGSDRNSAGCYSCNPNDCLTKVSSVIPVVKVTIGGTTTTYYDTGQILNTHGVDQAGCPYTGERNDESQNWLPITATLPANFAVQRDASGEMIAVTSPARELWLATPYPNPSHGRLVFSFRIGSTQEVHLGVYDITGRLVRQSLDGTLDAGDYRDDVDLSNLASGAYFCRLATHDGTLRKMFMLIR